MKDGRRENLERWPFSPLERALCRKFRDTLSPQKEIYRTKLPTKCIEYSLPWHEKCVPRSLKYSAQVACHTIRCPQKDFRKHRCHRDQLMINVAPRDFPTEFWKQALSGPLRIPSNRTSVLCFEDKPVFSATVHDIGDGNSNNYRLPPDASVIRRGVVGYWIPIIT